MGRYQSYLNGPVRMFIVLAIVLAYIGGYQHVHSF